MKARIFVVATLLLALSACEGAVELAQPRTVQVTLALDGSTIEVVDAREAGDAMHATPDEGEVHFVFHPEDGSPSVDGRIADTRVLRSEFDEHGLADPLWIASSAGLLDIELPAQPGQLTLWTANGELLGDLEIDPEGLTTRRAALLRQSDVVGAPVKIVDHGAKSSKIDILFLPEGYTSADLGQFRQHVQSITNQLSRESGYAQYWDRINVWRQDVTSRSRGTGSNGRPRDTAFETASGISGVDRCVFFANAQGQQAARSLGNQAGADVVIVLVNRTTTGACAGGGMIVTSRPSHVSQTVAHELGHALFGLADEYDTPRPGGQCSTGPNVARSLNSLPWADMLTTSRLPTPSSAARGTIGAFQGAGYCAQGRYRPTHDCLMRSFGADFCPVCQREIARKMASYSRGSASSGSATSSSTSGGSSSTTSAAAPRTPAGLSPNNTRISDLQVRLTWGSVSGASNYKLTVERQVSGSWRAFGSLETAGTAARVNVPDQAAQYRWTVQACNQTACSASATATFAYGAAASSGGSSSSTTSSSGALAAPTNLQPARSSVVSDQTPSLSWGAVSGATHYRFKMLWHDGNSWLSYVSAQDVNSTRVTTTLRTAERWYAFAVQACGAGGCSAWTEPSTLYYRP